MTETIAEIKKGEFEEWIKHWKELQHPLVPGKEAIERYRKLILKYVKCSQKSVISGTPKSHTDFDGKRALLLGATWQLRDLLAELGFHVTVVDISLMVIEAHAEICKIKKRKEMIVVSDWLTLKTDEKFDLVIADDSNFMLKEGSYNNYFKNCAQWLKDDGVSIQTLEGDFKCVKTSLQEIIDFIKKASDEELSDYRKKAYYYLGYLNYKHGNNFGDIADIENNLMQAAEEGKVSQEKVERFILHVKKFMVTLLPKEKIEKYVKKYFDIVETTPNGSTFVEEAFYNIYVMKRK